MATHPDADIQVSGGESGVGIQEVGEGIVDIGMTSREVTPDERARYPGFVITPVAHDGLAIIVNPANSIQNISLDQARDIYLGKITDWEQIPGIHLASSNSQIVVVGRDTASGSRSLFDQVVLKNATPSSGMLEKSSNGALLQTVSQTSGSIGYLSVGFVNEDVRALPIWYNQSLVAPTRANVKTKTYPLSRDLYLVTNGQPSGLTGDFIRFIISSAGQKIVENQGFVAINSS